MTTSADNTGEKPSIPELQADIEQTRSDLGDTVEALTAKLDVKTRTKERLTATKDQAAAKFASTKDQAAVKLGEGKSKAVDLAGTARDRATDDEGKPTPQVLGGAGGLVALIVAAVVVIFWRKRS